MRRLLFLVPLLLGACDAAPGPASASSSGSGSVFLAGRTFAESVSFDWNFRLGSIALGDKVTFRTLGVPEAAQGRRTPTSTITMTRTARDVFAFATDWPGYSASGTEVYAVVLDADAEEGLRVVGPYAMRNDSTRTPAPGKSYHKTPNGPIIDFVDVGDGFAPTPTTARIPAEGVGEVVVRDVAYLVFLPTGTPHAAWTDRSVRIDGPPHVTVITESLGYDQLPRTVLGVLGGGS